MFGDRVEEDESTKQTEKSLLKNQEESGNGITEAKEKAISIRSDRLPTECYQELKCDKERRVSTDAIGRTTDKSGRHPCL